MPAVSPLPHRPTPTEAPLRPMRAERRRNRPLLVGGVVVLVLCALVFASVYSGAATRTSVLAVARPVPAGGVIGDADLRDVEISAGPGVAPVPASERSRIVGRRVAVALAPGTLLARSQFGGGLQLAAGEALVSLALPAGRFPPEISPGATVAVVTTAASGVAASAGQPPDAGAEAPTGAVSLPPGALTRGRVLSLRPLSANKDGVLVSLVVPEQTAAAVLAAGATERVGLLLAGSAP